MNFTNPTNLEVAEYIRFWLGGLTDSNVSDSTILTIIDIVEARDPTYTPCDLVYHSTVELLNWFIRAQARGSSGAAGSGAVKSRTEKSGDWSVQVDYDVGVSGGVTSSWEGVLDDLKSNPDSIGCPVSRDDIIAVSDAGACHFGGVSVAEVDRVNNDTDSRNGWSYSSPFRQHLTGNKKLY